MTNSLIHGFIRPDGSILKGNDHDALAREEFKNKASITHLKKYEFDPYIRSSLNLVKAGYLLFCADTITLPNNPTKIQLNILIDMLANCDISDVPVFDSFSAKSIKDLSNSINDLNNPTLKFIKSYLEEIYNDKVKDNEIEH